MNKSRESTPLVPQHTQVKPRKERKQQLMTSDRVSGTGSGAQAPAASVVILARGGRMATWAFGGTRQS